MRTQLTIRFNNGVTTECVFNLNINKFHEKWRNHILGVGYFTNIDDDGETIIINPSQCGLIHIEEIE
jgi:hypothetical protein